MNKIVFSFIIHIENVFYIKYYIYILTLHEIESILNDKKFGSSSTAFFLIAFEPKNREKTRIEKNFYFKLSMCLKCVYRKI